MKCISRYLIQWVSLVAAWFWVNMSLAEQIHIAHCLDGCPVELVDSSQVSVGDEQQIVVRHLYAASIRPTGLAEWVAYRVLPGTVGVASLLPRYWKLDELSRSATALESEVGESTRILQLDLSDSQDRDYRVNEVTLLAQDRGRLAPMTSFASTPYWDELNYLSNMTPLPTALRTGPWSRLDQALNELARSGNSYYVVSGPLYSDVAKNDSAVSDPDSFFKLIASNDQLAVFVFPAHVEPQSAFCDYGRSLTELSALSGLDFYPKSTSQKSENLAAELGCLR